jgi:hypothetical protein
MVSRSDVKTEKSLRVRTIQKLMWSNSLEPDEDDNEMTYWDYIELGDLSKLEPEDGEDEEEEETLVDRFWGRQ